MTSTKKNAPVEVQLDEGQTIHPNPYEGEEPMNNIISPTADDREPRATYLDEEHGRYVFDTSGGECDYCAPGETCHLCDGFTETVEHFEAFSDVDDDDEPTTAVATPSMLDAEVRVVLDDATSTWFVSTPPAAWLTASDAARMTEALSDAADIAARLNAPAGVTDGATINERMVAAVTGSRLTLTQWARELNLSVPALRRRLTGSTAWTVGNLATVARVHGLSPAVVVADLPEVRRPLDQCAEPQIDGIGGGL